VFYLTNINKNEFIKVDFTGSVNNNVFDTTSEETAKKAGIHKQGAKYGPATIIVGSGQVLKGLDNAFSDAKIGEETSVRIKPEEGFGTRDAGKVRLVAMKNFKDQGIKPFPGMPVDINNERGRVQSVSGGRVRVDFNHELAGKPLEYVFTVHEKITDKSKQVNELFKIAFPYADLEKQNIKIEGKTITVNLSEDLVMHQHAGLSKATMGNMVLSYMKDIENIQFVEEFKKKNPDKTEEKTDSKK